MLRGRFHSASAAALLALVVVALVARPAHAARPAPAAALAAAGGARAARRLLQSTSYAFYMQNQCHRTISVAVMYDIPGQGWTVDSWYELAMGERAGPFYTDNYRYRLYAQTVTGDVITWGGPEDCSDCYYGARGGDSWPFTGEYALGGDSTPDSPSTQALTC